MYKIQNVVLPSTWWYGTGIILIPVREKEERRGKLFWL
jgi:hypothetical protein